MVRSRGLRPANGASCAVGLMMLIFFLGAAQAVPLYKMNNEIVNDNNSILDSDLHNLAFADSDTAVVAAPCEQPSPPYMTPCPAYIDNLPETPELICSIALSKRPTSKPIQVLTIAMPAMGAAVESTR